MACVDVMHQRIEPSGVSHQPVQSERRLAGGGADYFVHPEFRGLT